MTSAAALSDSNQTISRAWLRHGGALAVMLLFAVLAFHNSVRAALQVWWVSPTYSHCFLIIPIVAWLTWEKWPILTKITPSLAPLTLILIPFLSLGWWLGELSAINEIQQYAVVGIMQVLIVALLGTQVARVIWFPILYLIFLVPTGEYLIGPMQQFATRFADTALNLLGIVHYTEGTILELANGRFEVAEACAGLRFLIATVTLGVLFSYMMFRKLYKAVLFLIACVAVPLIGNGLRVVGIIVLAHFTNNEYGAGADHIVYGWGFNIAILLVLGILGSFFRDDVENNSVAPPASPRARAALAPVTALAALLIGTGPALAWWHNNYFTKPDLQALTAPLNVPGWHQGPPSAFWRPHFTGADAQILASLMRSESRLVTPVDFFISYYARPRPGHAMTAHVNKLWDEKEWSASNRRITMAKFGRTDIPFRESVIASSMEKRIVWSVYWVNGHFTPSPFRVKLLQTAAALQGREGQAVIAFSTPIDGTIEDARAHLSRALLSLDQVTARLNQANQPAQSASAKGP